MGYGTPKREAEVRGGVKSRNSQPGQEAKALPQGSRTTVPGTATSRRRGERGTGEGEGARAGAGAGAVTQRLSQRIKAGGGQRQAGWPSAVVGGVVAAVGSAGKAPAGRDGDGDGQAASAVRRRGSAVRGPAGAARRRAARERGRCVRGEAVRPRVHPRRHLHLRRVPLEAALPAGGGAGARGR